MHCFIVFSSLHRCFIDYNRMRTAYYLSLLKSAGEICLHADKQKRKNNNEREAFVTHGNRWLQSLQQFDERINTE